MPKPVRIRDYVVVITGASSGIGRATALALAVRGTTLVLAARDEAALGELARQCERQGGGARAVPTDVTDEHAVQELARTAIETFGRIDAWVNNAAVTLFGRTEEVPTDAYRRVLETNLFGCVHGARAAIPYMREQGHGVLINVSSVAGRIPQPYTSAYCASKAGIIMLSQCLRQELMDAPEIHVCTVLPRSTDTPLFQHGANYSGRAVQPIPPIDTPEQVAAAIVDCIEHPQRQVTMGGQAGLALALQPLLPGTIERMAARKVEQEHFQDRGAAPSEGNLFDPMPGWSVTRGGWRQRQQQQQMGWTGTMLSAGAAAVGAGLLVCALAHARHDGWKARARARTRRRPLLAAALD